MPLAAHCEAAGFQLTPPSAVSKTFVLPRFQMAAWNASVARTPPRSSSSGEWRRAQCEPASVVRRMVPARPTIQQTLSEEAAPAVRSTSTLLVCRDQEAPPSLENSTLPAGPARQRIFRFGATIKFKLEAPATAIKPFGAPVSPKAAEVAGGGGSGAGEGGEAARRKRGDNSDFSFLVCSTWP